MIYIGSFLYLAGEEKAEEAQRRHGEFSLFVEAPTIETAIHRFRDKISEIHESGDFFDGRTSIFIHQLLGVERFPETAAMMLNFKSQAGDPVMPFIGCTHPTPESDDCKIYEWEEAGLKIDDEKRVLFMAFNEHGAAG